MVITEQFRCFIDDAWKFIFGRKDNLAQFGIIGLLFMDNDLLDFAGYCIQELGVIEEALRYY
jgi:hypothetical protein